MDNQILNVLNEELRELKQMAKQIAKQSELNFSKIAQALAVQTELLEVHSKMSNQHSTMLSGHEAMLSGHAAMMDRLTKRMDLQDDVLDKISQRLGSHEEKQVKQDVILDKLVEKLEHHDQTFENHIKLLQALNDRITLEITQLKKGTS